MFDQIPPELRNAGPGVAGSMLALLFLRRPPLMLAGMFLGGCVLSFFATPWLSAYLEVGIHGASLVGFLVGMFGMATTAKVYDFFEVVEVSQIWKALIDFIRKRLGVEDKQ
jgi:uncharacterized membrane protein YraQ (UPF0718 family)